MLPLGPRAVRVRPLTPADGDALLTVFAGLSPASRRARFLSPVDHLTEAMQRALLAVDDTRHVGLVAEARQGAGRTAVGLARYVVDGPGQAEIAYEVADAWQGRGIGTRLLRKLVATARRHGVERLHASIRPDNDASLALLRRLLPQLRVVDRGDELAVTAWLAEPPIELDDLLLDLAA